MIPARKTFTLVSISAFVFMLALSLGAPAVAEDLSDNETCNECHADEPRSAPENTDRPRVHNDDGTFSVEDHDMWSCTDCHDMITEIPHTEGVDGQAVNCENCHDSTPTL